jgi:plasmid rolling circle replication initiator protein Rep
LSPRKDHHKKHEYKPKSENVASGSSTKEWKHALDMKAIIQVQAQNAASLGQYKNEMTEIESSLERGIHLGRKLVTSGNMLVR